ncbi:MAG: hypothetical protein LVS60_01710 [Nodosilinea sp. LVE1205-7]|jgi:hypothetical protein
MSGPESLPHLDRLALSQALAKLPDPQFKQVVFALEPPASILPADSSSLGDRVASLLQWVENNGPGLAALQRVLGQVSQPSGRDRPDPDPPLCLVSMPANPFFTGRETLLTAIHRTLSERGRAALYGLGDLGKTQTARAYVEQHRSAYHQHHPIAIQSFEIPVHSSRTLIRKVKI